MKANLQTVVMLIVGAVIGAVASTLIRGTLPPAEGSAEERVAKLEYELKQTRTELKAMEDISPRKRFGASTHDGVRSIAKAMKEGHPVTPDDIFNAFKPLMRDLSPLTERIRMLEARRDAESLAGTYARKYGLGDAEQAQLIDQLAASHESQGKQIQDILESDHTSLRDFMKAEREFDARAGLDVFMEQRLQGEKLQAYQSERMTEKSEKVQSDADLQVERISNIVELDDAQRHQMFLYMAQTSPHYDSRMQFQDLQSGMKPLPPNSNRNDAMYSVLRPEQRKAYDAYKEKQLEERRQEAARIGLTIPHDWDPDDDIW